MSSSVDKTAPLLILRRSLGPLHHGTLAAARTMGRQGVPVFVARGDRSEPCTDSRYVSGSLPDPVARDPEAWVRALLDCPAALDGGVLLPVDDDAAVLVADHAAQLGRRFRVTPPRNGLHRRLASKAALADLAQEHDVAMPRSAPASSAEEAAGLGERFGFPLVLKAADVAETQPGVVAASVVISPDASAVTRDFKRVTGDRAGRVLVQEFLSPEVATIWMFNGYFDAESACRFAATGVKLRQHPLSGGATTFGVCRRNPELEAIAEGLMRDLGYCGPVDMDFCFDRRDRRYKLLDVNPRVGATFRLFATDDIDVVRALHLDLTGQGIPGGQPPDGRGWLDEASDLSAWRDRSGTAYEHSWSWRSLRSVDETAWWARDDPMPFARMASALPRRVLRQLLTRK